MTLQHRSHRLAHLFAAAARVAQSALAGPTLDVTKIATATNQRRAATAQRRLATAGLLVLMAMAGGALAGCGDDENPAASGQRAEANPTDTAQAEDPTGNTYDATSEPPDASIEIAMKDIAFNPAYITARVGQTLVFTNEDDVAHKLESNEGQPFKSKTLNKGQTYKYRIKNDADLRAMNFICTIHPAKMEGGVVVTE